MTLGCRTRPSVALQRYEFQQVQMGLPFRLVLWAPTGMAATNAADAAFRRIAALNAALSDYEEESELSRLSRTSGSGQWIRVSDDLWKVLRRADAVSERSQGAFDVTVGPMVQLWRRARRQRELPPTERIAAAKQSVGWRHIHFRLQSQEVMLDVPGMRLDLGGIAKGYALDEVGRVLRPLQIERFLIAGSGDMVVGEPPPGQKGWRIEIAPLDVTNAPPARFVSLRNASLCTSGDVFQRVEIGGKRYSHIVDPARGVGLTDHSLVTVIGRDGMTTDALSTAVSVAGPAAAEALVQSFGAEVLIVRQPDTVFELKESSGFHRWLDRTPGSSGASVRP